MPAKWRAVSVAAFRLPFTADLLNCSFHRMAWLAQRLQVVEMVIRRVAVDVVDVVAISTAGITAVQIPNQNPFAN